MKETGKVFSKYPLLSISFVALLSLTLIFNNILLGNTVHISSQNEKIRNWADAYFYTLTDSISQEVEEVFWHVPDCVQRMKNAVDQFETGEYTYCIFTHQATRAADFSLPDEYYYFLPRTQEGAPLYSEGLLDTYQLNQNAWELFDLQIEEGTGFEESDYIYQTIVPVVVGAEYRDYLNVSSELECHYMGQLITLRVVGILKKDSLIVRQGAVESLDWSIVMPSLRLENVNDLDLSHTSEMGSQLRKIYIQKLGGTFALSNSAELSQLMLYVNDVFNECGVFKHEFIAMPREGISLLSNITSQYQRSKGMWNLAMFSLLILCFSRFVGLIFRKNAKRYAVLVLAGASRVQVLQMVMASTMTFVMLANFVAYFMTYLFIGIRYNLWLCVFSILLDVAISLCMLQKNIKASDGLISFLERE